MLSNYFYALACYTCRAWYYVSKSDVCPSHSGIVSIPNVHIVKVFTPSGKDMTIVFSSTITVKILRGTP